jgi:hypothetical protein
MAAETRTSNKSLTAKENEGMNGPEFCLTDPIQAVFPSESPIRLDQVNTCHSPSDLILQQPPMPFLPSWQGRMFPPEPVHVPDVVLLNLFLLFGHGVGPSGGSTKPDGLGTWSVGHDRDRLMLLLRGSPLVRCHPERDTDVIGLICMICDLVMKVTLGP